MKVQSNMSLVCACIPNNHSDIEPAVGVDVMSLATRSPEPKSKL